MSWINRRIIAPISPQWALARERAARGLNAYYESAEPSRLHKSRNDRRSANAQNQKGALPIRSQARHADENFDIASGVLDILVANTVGRGIQPEPQVMLKSGDPATDINRALLKLFDPWSYAPEVTAQHHYYGLQRLLARSWFRDGEVFTQKIIGQVPGLQHGSTLPYSLEGLEADFVPLDMMDQAQGIVQGIEVSAWGRPKAYWVYKQHPGDTGLFAGTFLETKRMPAEQMLHVAFRKRLHQLRGISIFATVLNRFDDLKEVDENERVAARVASAMAGFIKKGQPDSYEGTSEIGPDGKPQRRDMFFEPGIIFDDLLPGEDVGTIDTTRPNNALIPFRDSQLRSAASGVMTSFSSMSKNYDGTYSAQRQELVEQWAVYQTLGSEFTCRFAQPVWDGFIDAVQASGAIAIPSTVDRDTLYDCSHTGPSMVWIDPQKEVDGQILQMRWGFKSRTKIIRERGDNPDVVNREILRDQQELEKLGITLIGDAPSPTPEEGKQPTDDTPTQKTQKAQKSQKPAAARVLNNA